MRDLTIERTKGETYQSNDWTVYEHATYPPSSVLAGQHCRVLIRTGYATPEAALADYPDAVMLEGTTWTPIDSIVAHLPGDDDFGYDDLGYDDF